MRCNWRRCGQRGWLFLWAGGIGGVRRFWGRYGRQGLAAAAAEPIDRLIDETTHRARQCQRLPTRRAKPAARLILGVALGALHGTCSSLPEWSMPVGRVS